MKHLSIILILSFLILSCKNESKLTKETKSDFKELSDFKDYNKYTDTSYAKNGNEPTHRITHLKKNNDNLVLFKRIIINEKGVENQTILDTLSIKNLDNIFYITIGYCEMENSTPEEIIAIVERTDKDTIKTIAKAWKANSETRKIENIKNLGALTCLNEF